MAKNHYAPYQPNQIRGLTMEMDNCVSGKLFWCIFIPRSSYLYLLGATSSSSVLLLSKTLRQFVVWNAVAMMSNTAA